MTVQVVTATWNKQAWYQKMSDFCEAKIAAGETAVQEWKMAKTHYEFLVNKENI